MNGLAVAANDAADVALTELHFEDRHFAARNFRQHHVVRKFHELSNDELEEFLHSKENLITNRHQSTRISRCRPDPAVAGEGSLLLRGSHNLSSVSRTSTVRSLGPSRTGVALGMTARLLFRSKLLPFPQAAALFRPARPLVLLQPVLNLSLVLLQPAPAPAPALARGRLFSLLQLLLFSPQLPDS